MSPKTYVLDMIEVAVYDAASEVFGKLEHEGYNVTKAYAVICALSKFSRECLSTFLQESDIQKEEEESEHVTT